MGVSAVGVPASAEGSLRTVAPAWAASSVTSSAALGAGPAASEPPTGPDASRTRLSAPAAKAIPPTANRNFRGRGRRCRPRGRGAEWSGAAPTRSAGSADAPDATGERGIADGPGATDGLQGADDPMRRRGRRCQRRSRRCRRRPRRCGSRPCRRRSWWCRRSLRRPWCGRRRPGGRVRRHGSSLPCAPVSPGAPWRSAEYVPGWAVWLEKVRMSLVRGKGRRDLSTGAVRGALVGVGVGPAGDGAVKGIPLRGPVRRCRHQGPRERPSAPLTREPAHRAAGLRSGFRPAGSAAMIGATVVNPR